MLSDAMEELEASNEINKVIREHLNWSKCEQHQLMKNYFYQKNLKYTSYSKVEKK